MYWYYKYPLIFIGALLALGLLFLLWRALVSPFFSLEKKPEPVPAFVTAAPNLPAPPSLPGVPANTPPYSATPAPANPPAATRPKPNVPQAAPLPKELAAELARLSTLLENDPLAARESARQLLSGIGCQEFDGRWQAIAQIIDRANAIFMNSTAPCPEKRPHTVVKGDTLSRIAEANHTTVGGLQRINTLSRTSSLIRPGQVFQCLSGQWKITVSKSHFLLALYLDGALYRIWRIGTGRQNRTPPGTFVIQNKLLHPAWTYEGQNIPYGDPRNILGPRWMGLQPTGNTDPALRGFGIHGTTEPDSIGTASSLGCVRMNNDEVEELYDFIPNPSAKRAPTEVLILE
ncbi:MAG: L,D-transpeptidase family protein [Victivallales bacterium]|nr:L,D-transpeptidase family protein [Victivallales bacterium]